MLCPGARHASPAMSPCPSPRGGTTCPSEPRGCLPPGVGRTRGVPAGVPGPEESDREKAKSEHIGAHGYSLDRMSVALPVAAVGWDGAWALTALACGLWEIT